FTPDGTLLATGSVDQTVKLWDVATGKEKKTLEVGQPVKTLAFAPDGRTVSVGTWPYLGPNDQAWAVSQWDVAIGARRREELRLKCPINPLAYSADGRMIAVGGLNKYLWLWTPEPCAKCTVLAGHQPREAWALVFSPDGKTLISAGDDHAL